jgi:hypothetical protein
VYIGVCVVGYTNSGVCKIVKGTVR